MIGIGASSLPQYQSNKSIASQSRTVVLLAALSHSLPLSVFHTPTVKQAKMSAPSSSEAHPGNKRSVDEAGFSQDGEDQEQHVAKHVERASDAPPPAIPHESDLFANVTFEEVDDRVPSWVEELRQQLKDGKGESELFQVLHEATHRLAVMATRTSSPCVVTEGHAILKDELDHVDATAVRQKRSAALSRFLSENASSPSSDTGTSAPRVALCFSGGGVRAMIGTMAYLTAFAKLGLVDASSYIAALSGSSWAVSAWYGNRDDSSNRLVRDDAQHAKDPWVYGMKGQADWSDLKQHVCTTPMPSIGDDLTMSKAVLHKVHMGRSLDLCDVWGLYLGYRFLKPAMDNHWSTDGLSDTLHKIQQHQLPVPIITAVMPEHPKTDSTKLLQHWVEMTPFSTFARVLECSIPTQAFGCRFQNGTQVAGSRSDDQLHYMMGISGSAFGAPLAQVSSYFPGPLRLLYNKLVELYPEMGGWSIARVCGLIQNFEYHADHRPKHFASSVLQMVDAGSAFNLPLPPLVRRGVEILVVCDMTMGMEDDPAGELRKAADHFAADPETANAFPALPPGFGRAKYGKVQNDERLVIYLPALGDEDFVVSTSFPTSNLTPTPELVDKYFQLILDNVQANVTQLADDIQAFLIGSHAE